MPLLCHHGPGAQLLFLWDGEGQEGSGRWRDGPGWNRKRLSEREEAVEGRTLGGVSKADLEVRKGGDHLPFSF